MKKDIILFEKFVEIVIGFLDSVPSKAKNSSEEDKQFLKTTFNTIKKRKGYVEISDATLTGETMRSQLKCYEW